MGVSVYENILNKHRKEEVCSSSSLKQDDSKGVVPPHPPRTTTPSLRPPSLPVFFGDPAQSSPAQHRANGESVSSALPRLMHY